MLWHRMGLPQVTQCTGGGGGLGGARKPCGLRAFATEDPSKPTGQAGEVFESICSVGVTSAQAAITKDH